MLFTILLICSLVCLFICVFGDKGNKTEKRNLCERSCFSSGASGCGRPLMRGEPGVPGTNCCCNLSVLTGEWSKNK